MLFDDRADAGRALADRVQKEVPRPKDPIVLGIPRGGVPIGYPLAERLQCPLDVLVLRKLPLPQNDQMGFGAVTLGKKVMLNQRLIDAGYVRRDQIGPIVDEVYEEVLRRSRVYRGDRPFPDLAGRTVFLVDDGLATGYTMLAGLQFARDAGAERLVAAVPVAHENSFELVNKQADQVICLHVDQGYSFAVASFYRSFPDLEDQEVTLLLEENAKRIRQTRR
ncbi:MAG: phosphoribosyltransferase [Deltaproteobacteria bacterium]|nr:phosphoribosyltransferase [Deltaproteobacteria bacterium]